MAALVGRANERAVAVLVLIRIQAPRSAVKPPLFWVADRINARLQMMKVWATIKEKTTAPMAEKNSEERPNP